MSGLLITLHVTAGAIVVGVLFVQSLAVVMALRLRGQGQREGARMLQERVQRFIYYPIGAVAVLTGFWLAGQEDAFSQGRWLHWKLVLVVLLAGLGLLTSRGIRAERPLKPAAMAVHVGVFIVSAWIIYLAVLQPM